MAKGKKRKKGKKGKKENNDYLSTNDHVPGSGSFDTIPRGEYSVIMVKAEKKDTKAGDGVLQFCQFKVIDGEFENRIIFHNFNIVNPSEKAVDISVSLLKDFMYMVNIKKCDKFDLTALLNRPVTIGVGIRKGDDQYADQNNITKFLALESSGKKKGKKGKKGKKSKGKPDWA